VTSDASVSHAASATKHGTTGASAGDLARAGVRGAAWQGAAFVVGKAVVLLTTVVLARLLAPEQFGLVSLALVLIIYAEAFADVGAAQALIYFQPRVSTIRAALLCTSLVGVLLLAAGVLMAPLIGDFFGRQDVVPIVRLLAVSLLFSALGAVPEALLRRALQFRRLTVATVTRAVATGVVSIALAIAGFGAWAIAWGTLAGTFSYAVAVWLLVPERVALLPGRTSPGRLNAVLRYGIPVAGGTLLAKLIFDVDYLIVGHQLGVEALGFYTLAFRIPEFLIINVFFVISSVSFPVYSRARSDHSRLTEGYLLSTRMQALYGVTAGVGIAVVAPLLVPLVFGEAWRPAVAPLVGLAIYAACRSLGAGANEIYKALGRPGLTITVSLLRLAVLVPVLILAARWGVTGVAWAQALTSLVFVVLMQGVACRVLRITPSRLAAAVLPALLCGLAIVLVAGPLSRIPAPPLAALGCAVAGGLAATTAVLAVGFRPLLRGIAALMRRPRVDATI
jgi:lipopolysaccharide exporter